MGILGGPQGGPWVPPTDATRRLTFGCARWAGSPGSLGASLGGPGVLRAGPGGPLTDATGCLAAERVGGAVHGGTFGARGGPLGTYGGSLEGLSACASSGMSVGVAGWRLCLFGWPAAFCLAPSGVRLTQMAGQTGRSRASRLRFWVWVSGGYPGVLSCWLLGWSFCATWAWQWAGALVTSGLRGLPWACLRGVSLWQLPFGRQGVSAMASAQPGGWPFWLWGSSWAFVPAGSSLSGAALLGCHQGCYALGSWVGWSSPTWGSQGLPGNALERCRCGGAH